jgi:outer membrane phospholipase A
MCLFFYGILHGTKVLGAESTSADDSAPLKEPNLLSLSRYKPIYFLLGDPLTKIQLSFETQIVKDIPIYFAYTQLMLWDLFATSPHFYELNYDPLILYRLAINDWDSQWLDLIPWEHESNGTGGEREVAWDRTAVVYHRVDLLAGKLRFYQDYKVWVPIGYKLTNTNLGQYRGLWELDFTVSGLLADVFILEDLTLRIYPGGVSNLDPLSGGQEITLRGKSLSGSFLPSASIQVFHGYGEDLKDYSVSQWGIRAGLGF